MEELQPGNNTELFGVGTAAVISPVSCVQIEGVDYYPYAEKDAVMFLLKNELENIRRGRTDDKHCWNHFIKNESRYLKYLPTWRQVIKDILLGK